MNLNRKIIVIYGGGRFGFNAIQKLKGHYNLIIVDLKTDCFIAEYFHLKTESFHSVLGHIQNMPLKNPDHSQTSMNFILGNESVLLKITNEFLPEYLIPCAPVHVMANLIQQYLLENYPSVKMNLRPFLIDMANKPKELFQFSSDKPEVYFSYAAWDELCPEHCVGPEKYCIHHKRDKPITISNFIDDNIDEQHLLHFRSQQLHAGLGGISGIAIKESFSKLDKIFTENQIYRSINLNIATSCNCHGVISSFHIKIN